MRESRDYWRDRAEAAERDLTTAKEALESLKGEETTSIGEATLTRIVSYHVLNRRIDAILRSLDGEEA